MPRCVTCRAPSMSPIQTIAQYEVVDTFKEVLNLSLAQQQVCLGEAVEDVNRMSGHAAIAARAWAVGDVKTVEANYARSRLYDCVTAAVQHVADLSERNISDTVTAIDGALNKPGKTIVEVAIGPLLRRNGVLQRLAERCTLPLRARRADARSRRQSFGPPMRAKIIRSLFSCINWLKPEIVPRPRPPGIPVSGSASILP